MIRILWILLAYILIYQVPDVKTRVDLYYTQFHELLHKLLSPEQDVKKPSIGKTPPSSSRSHSISSQTGNQPQSSSSDFSKNFGINYKGQYTSPGQSY